MDGNQTDSALTRPAAERLISDPEAVITGKKSKELPSHGAFAVHKAIETANGRYVPSYGGAPDHVTTLTDDLLRCEWKPPLQFDLSMHAQPNRGRKPCPWSYRVFKIAPRGLRKPGDLNGPKRTVRG